MVAVGSEMEAAAERQDLAGVCSLSRALVRTRPQERPGCPSASSGGSEAESRVLVINTGGTIGMVQDVKGEGASGGEGSGAGRRGALPLGGKPAWRGVLRDAPLGEWRLRLPLPYHRPCFVTAAWRG